MKCPYCNSGRVWNFFHESWDCKSCKKISHECFGCGELVIRGGDHHCDPKREKQILDARKSHDELGIERGRSEYERFVDGCRQIEGD